MQVEVRERSVRSKVTTRVSAVEKSKTKEV